MEKSKLKAVTHDPYVIAVPAVHTASCSKMRFRLYRKVIRRN